MKITISENRLEQLIFKYLDKRFENLEQSEGFHSDIIFNFPGEEFGILGWRKINRILYINNHLIDDIFSFIPIEKSEIQNIIGRYVQDRYGLKGLSTLVTRGLLPFTGIVY